MSAESDDPKVVALKGKRRADPLGDLNSQHFVVIHGGKAMVARVIHDELLKRERLDFLKPADFSMFHANRRVQVGTDKAGNAVWAPLGKTWLAWGDRRTYSSIALLPAKEAPPDVYNLWRGWGVQPKAGSWARIHEHWLDVLCSGNQEHFDYFVRWNAHKVQNLCDPAGVCSVFRGEEGIGKGLGLRPMQRIYGSHALQISNPKHLTGNFNAHLLDTLFLFVDEGFWAGDKSAEGVLKALITEEWIMIEPKGLGAFAAPSRLAIAMATNSEWVIPAGRNARRFFVLDVSDHRRGDFAYHKELAAAINGNETPALLNHLLNLDLSDFNIRDFPRTAALAEQKMLSLDTFGKWWHWCLKHGLISGDPDRKYWPSGRWRIGKETLRNSYYQFARDRCNDRYPLDPSQITKHLKMYCGDLDIDNAERRREEGRARKFNLYSLAEHREAFLRSFQVDPAAFDWGTDDE